MGVSGAEQPSCPSQTDCEDFQGVMNLKDGGLVVYCHNSRKDDVIPTGTEGSKLSSSAAPVFVIESSNDENIKPHDYISSLDKDDISCPRCKSLMERAQKLLLKVTSINERDLMRVCEHCRLKALSKKTLYGSDDAVKKLMTSRDEQKEDTKKHIKLWLSKMKHLIKRAATPDKAQKVKLRSYSDIQLDRLCRSQYSPTSIHEPEVKQLFQLESHKSDTNLYTDIDEIKFKEQDIFSKSVTFAEQEAFAVTPYSGGPISTRRQGPSLVGSDVTMIEPSEIYRETLKSAIKSNQEIKRNNIPFLSLSFEDMDINTVMKKMHDLTLRHMIKPGKDSSHMLHTVTYSTEIRKDTKTAKPVLEKQTDDAKHFPTPDSEVYKSEKRESQMEYNFLPEEQTKTNEQNKKDLELEYYDGLAIDLKLSTKRKRELSFNKELIDELNSVSQDSIKIKPLQKDFKDLRESYRTKERFSDIKGKIKRKYGPSVKHAIGMERKIDRERYGIDKQKKPFGKKALRSDTHYLSDEKSRQLTPKISSDIKQIELTDTAENLLKGQFSFFFPKEKTTKIIKIGVDSSELIRTTQEKLRKRAENEEKQKSEMKLDESDKKPFARDVKQLSHEQKKQEKLQKELDKDIQRQMQFDREKKQDRALKVEENIRQRRAEQLQYADESVHFIQHSKEKILKEEELKRLKEKKYAKEDDSIKRDEKEKRLKKGDEDTIHVKSAEEKSRVRSAEERRRVKSAEETKHKKSDDNKTKADKDKKFRGDEEKERRDADKKMKGKMIYDEDKKIKGKMINDQDKKPKGKMTYDEETKTKEKITHDDDKKLKENKIYDEEKKTKGKMIYDNDKKTREKITYDEDKKIKGKIIYDDEKQLKNVKEIQGRIEEKKIKGKDTRHDDAGKLKSDEEKKKRDDDKKNKEKTVYDDITQFKIEKDAQKREEDKKIKSKDLKKYDEKQLKSDEEKRRRDEDKKIMGKGKSIPGDEKQFKGDEEKQNQVEDKKIKTKGPQDDGKQEFKSEKEKQRHSLESKSKGKDDGMNEINELRLKLAAEKKAREEELKLQEKLKQAEEKKTKGHKEKQKHDEEQKLNGKEIKEKLDEDKKIKGKDKLTHDDEKQSKTKVEISTEKDAILDERDVEMKFMISENIKRREEEKKLKIQEEKERLEQEKKMKEMEKRRREEEKQLRKGKSKDSKIIIEEATEISKSKDMIEIKLEEEMQLRAEAQKRREEELDLLKQIEQLKKARIEREALKHAEEEQELKRIQMLSMKKIAKEATISQIHASKSRQDVDDLYRKQALIKEEEKLPILPKELPKDDDQLKKARLEHTQQREQEMKDKKQLEMDLEKARALAEQKAQQLIEQQMVSIREAKAVQKSEPALVSKHEESKKGFKEIKDFRERQVFREIKLREVRMMRPSPDDLVLQLVQFRQTVGKRFLPVPVDFDAALLASHRCHHKAGHKSSICELCNNSELELDVESYQNKQRELNKESEIIIGENIFKYKPPLIQESEEHEISPLLYKTDYLVDPISHPRIETKLKEEETREAMPIFTKQGIDQEVCKGIIRYALSDRSFIDKGWTMLPTEKVVRKMNVYRMRPAHPEFDWFQHNKNKRVMTYDTGEKLAEFDDNGRGRWFYRNGRIALDYYDAEEINAQQRYVVYSSGEPDDRGRSHPITILATFDYLGNGIVFDHSGKIRLKYNQTEGVVLDRGIGPVSHWKWHTLNDPPVLQQVMIDTQMAHKDPEILKLGSPADIKTRPDNEEMLAIEFDNFIKEKSKKLCQKFKPFQIKMKALKINENFSLKVLDQATIYLIFRDGMTNLKLNIGMILDHQEIVDTDTAEVGEVSNNIERFPARTDSLARLQRSVAFAQHYERQRTERERRLRPSEPCASADQLTAAASSPLRAPFRTLPTGSTSTTGYCKCKSSNNLYYNTRLL